MKMRRTLRTFLLSVVFAVALMGGTLADVAVPIIVKPRGYLPVLIISVAIIVIVVMVKRKRKRPAKRPIEPVIPS
jgi:hypothetical protein